MIMGFVRGEIDGAAESVEQAAVDMHAFYTAEIRVQFFGILVFQLGNRPKSQIEQILRDAFPDAGDGLELFQDGFGILHGER